MARNIYRVGQVNAYIKNLFAQDYALRQIAVRGEVSNCKYHTSGHIYFTLKDETGTLAAVMFAGQRAGLAFSLREGQNVIVQGSIMVYERDGRYQLYARQISPDGVGDLHQRFEELKRQLAEMGMFAPEYKQPIPRFAHKVGIVTASTGAAIQDIVNIASRRNPYVQLILYPAIVQGEQAAPSIVKGIRRLDAMGLDCLIVGRGGGSMEDLWAFNEEIVARAIFECETPVISAVGHETDTTIADYVADLRAPTPSAAAELAVYDVRGFYEQLTQQRNSIRRVMGSALNQSRLTLTGQSRRLDRFQPRYELNGRRQALANLELRMSEQMRNALQASRHRLAFAGARLEGMSPLAKLGQGYGYISRTDGTSIRSVHQVEPGHKLKVHLKDGQILAEVKEITKNGTEGTEHGRSL